MNLILEMLSEAKDKDLMMTRFDCHVKGLHSVVLKNESGKLTRCFLVENNHEMHLNINQRLVLPLGIHSHMYDIRLTQVSGEALNVIYRENKSLCNVSKYSYESEISGGRGSIYTGISGVEVCDVSRLNGCFMSHNELHTVYVPKGSKSSWVVQEGQQVTNKTDLFQNGSAKCSEFILPKSADQVRDFVSKFYG
jgi:hypothetical protein